MRQVTEHWSNPKNVGPCGCNCGKEGTYRSKAYRNGVLCTRNCDKSKCVNCRNKANQSRGKRAEVKRAKRAGVKATKDEETWRAAYRITHKDDKLHAGVVYRIWDKLQKEDDYKRPIGDSRPLVESFSQPGRPGGLILLDDSEAAIAALATQHGYVPAELEEDS